jgi:hypothetical protein
MRQDWGLRSFSCSYTCFLLNRNLHAKFYRKIWLHANNHGTGIFACHRGFICDIELCAGQVSQRLIMDSNWLPLLVVLTYVLAPFPNMICKRLSGDDDYFADDSRKGIRESGYFITMIFVVSGKALN